MSAVRKIAISLPAEVLERVEEKCRERGQTRSQFFRQAAEDDLRREKERQDIEDYIRSYEEMPETEEDVFYSDELVDEVLKEYPWE